MGMRTGQGRLQINAPGYQNWLNTALPFTKSFSQCFTYFFFIFVIYLFIIVTMLHIKFIQIVNIRFLIKETKGSV